MTIVEAPPGVTGGVDTHLDVHVAAALDPLGRLFGSESFATDAAGYRALLEWLDSSARSPRSASRGQAPMAQGSRGSCGASTSMSSRSTDRTAKHAAARARPTPSTRSRPHAQRSLAMRKVTRRRRDGASEAIRTLVVAKRSARQSRVKAIVQMRHLVISAPEALHPIQRAQGPRPHRGRRSAATGSLTRSGHRGHEVVAVLVGTSCPVPERRARHLDEQIAALVAAAAPELLALFGLGPDTAASLLIAAGDNPERLHSEAAWARLCGVAPKRADSGKVQGHHRLDDGGDRQANSALWRIVMVRIAHDPETTAYFERRVKEGRTKRDVIRILKRYVAREVYRYLPRG